jgi:hypothetical protein
MASFKVRQAKKNPYGTASKYEIQQIGKKVGLTGATLRDYTKLIQARFPKEFDRGYIKEWAVRFKDGKEWFVADGTTQGVLLGINPKYYAGFRDKVFYFKDKSDFAMVSLWDYMETRK